MTIAETIEPLPSGTRRTDDGRIESANGAELPRHCACCGDTLELHAFRTMPGGVRYFICREHLISAIARLVVSALMMSVAAWALTAGNVTGHKAQLAFCAIGLGGTVMAWLALPVRAGRSRRGWRTIHGLCAATADEVR